jgi:hypothetical protein
MTAKIHLYRRTNCTLFSSIASDIIQQMPLTEQETRCIGYACEFLSTAVGGRWNIERCLDGLNGSDPTPEVVVTNGETTAAIEVKRMFGDSAQQEYTQSLRSNERYLAPSCGGYYWIEPPIDLRLPLDDALRRQVKREIERVAPTLQPEGTGVLRIPRSGIISLSSELNPPLIFCTHSGCSDLFRPLLGRISGRFMLVDEGLEHSFFTDEGKEAFYLAVTSACKRRLEGDPSPFSWNEEWQINRLRDSEEGEEDRDGVWIIACTEARSVPASIEENLEHVLNNALRKFVKRWAPIHILVLDEPIDTHARQTQETIVSFGPDRMPNLDYVLLVSNDKVIQCYPNSNLFS